MEDGQWRLGDRRLLPLPRQEVLGDDEIARTVPDRREGRLDAPFTIPEDFGGVHEVIALVDGKRVAQGGIEVTQTFEMSPASGPVGTPIELTVKGLGWRTMESTWVVNWDNKVARIRLGGGHEGSAVARFRAPVRWAITFVKLLTGYRGRAT